MISERTEDAVERLWQRYGNQVYRFFLRKGFSTDESLDLRQDTFVRIQRYHSEDIGNEQGWILSIARTVWKNELRYRQAGKRYAPEVSLESGFDCTTLPITESERIGSRTGTDPLRRVLDEEEAKLLWEAIEDLPPRIRDCVVLRLRDELPYRAIGAILHVTEATVKTHMFQARQRLKEMLGRHFRDLVDPYMEERDD